MGKRDWNEAAEARERRDGNVIALGTQSQAN